MRTYTLALIAIAALALTGCGDDGEEATDSGATSTNSGTTSTNNATTSTNNSSTGTNNTATSTNSGTTSTNSATTSTNGDTTPTCGPPGEPYGTSEGSRFFPFTLNTCAGEPFSFYGEDEGYCDAKLTVVTLAAGWCGPCRVEAELMQEFLVEAYQDQGVRVIVAVIQDNDYGVPDAAFCDGWVEQYGLTNPVLLDPAQEVGIYFPDSSIPASVIVNSEGVIVFREYGVSDELSTIRAEIDRLLAE